MGTAKQGTTNETLLGFANDYVRVERMKYLLVALIQGGEVFLEGFTSRK